MEQPSFELPPQPENREPGADQAPQTQEHLVHTPEQTGNQAGSAAPPLQAPPAPPDPTQLQPAQGASEPTNVVVKSVPVVDDGLDARNVDLIEKEWVDKAKNIVAKTQDDPFNQKNEISKVKAQYIQKRFNKSIKADDSFDVAQSRPEQGRTGEAAV